MKIGARQSDGQQTFCFRINRVLWNRHWLQQQSVGQRVDCAVLVGCVDLQFRIHIEVNSEWLKERCIEIECECSDQTSLCNLKIASRIYLTQILHQQSAFSLYKQTVDADLETECSLDHEEIQQIKLAFTLHHGIEAGTTVTALPLRGACVDDVGQLTGIVVRVHGWLKLVQKVVVEIIALNEPLWHSDFLIKPTHVCNQAEFSTDADEVVHSSPRVNHKVCRKDLFLDRKHAHYIQVEQLKLRGPDGNGALREDFKSCGADFHGKHGTDAEEFQPERRVFIAVRNVEDHFPGSLQGKQVR